MRRLPALALAALATPVMAGCGTQTQTRTVTVQQPTPPKAAEPPAAPAPVGTPLGRLVPVGAKPEGIDVDPRSHTVAVAVQDPPRLVLLDGTTGRRIRTVPLPGTARHVTLARPGGPFLVPAETADTLVQVPLRGAPTSTRVGDAPHDATWLDGAAYTADEFGSTISEVRDGKLVRQVPVDAQPGGIVAVGDDLAISSVRAYTVELFRRRDLLGLGAQSAGYGPSHVKVDPSGRLYIADTRGKALVVYGTRPRLKFLARVPLGGAPLGLAVDAPRDRIWVSLAERNQVVALSLADVPRVQRRIPTVRQPDSAAVDPSTGVVYIASRTDGTVQRLTP